MAGRGGPFVAGAGWTIQEPAVQDDEVPEVNWGFVIQEGVWSLFLTCWDV